MQNVEKLIFPIINHWGYKKFSSIIMFLIYKHIDVTEVLIESYPM